MLNAIEQQQHSLLVGMEGGTTFSTNDKLGLSDF
jgi:hypothetical protein